MEPSNLEILVLISSAQGRGIDTSGLTRDVAPSSMAGEVLVINSYSSCVALIIYTYNCELLNEDCF